MAKKPKATKKEDTSNGPPSPIPGSTPRSPMPPSPAHSPFAHPGSPLPVPVPPPGSDAEYYGEHGDVNEQGARWSRGEGSQADARYHEDERWEHGSEPQYHPHSPPAIPPGDWSPRARYDDEPEGEWDGQHTPHEQDAWDAENGEDLYEDDHDDRGGHWPSPDPPIPVPPPISRNNTHTHSDIASAVAVPPKVRFAQTPAAAHLYPHPHLASPQLASAAALLTAPSPPSAGTPRLFRERTPTPPRPRPVPPAVLELANAPPDTGMYAEGWKTWAKEASRMPPAAKPPPSAMRPPPAAMPNVTNFNARSNLSQTMQRAQQTSMRSDRQANASWGTGMRREPTHDGGNDDWDEGFSDGEPEYDARTKSPPLMPRHPSHQGPVRSDTRRIVDAGGAALGPAELALFGTHRDSKDRLHWAFNPMKDTRVQATMALLEYLAYEAAQFGLGQFLRTCERGALFANAGLEDEISPVLSLDWLPLSSMGPSHDAILQQCTQFNDPAKEAVVFVFLLSKTGNSIAIWRRRIALPPDLVRQYANEIAAAKSTMKHASIRAAENPLPPPPQVVIPEIPPPVVVQPVVVKGTKLGKRRKDPSSKQKKRWWQFWRKKNKAAAAVA